MVERLEAEVLGRVQGVGFRAFVKRLGSSLGLKGYAKNLPNGSVEVIAEGSKQQLTEFLSGLREGNSSSRVSDVKTFWGKALGDVEGFSIKH